MLVVLSGTLVIDTLFSGLNAAQTALWLAAALVLGALAAGLATAHPLPAAPRGRTPGPR